MTKTNLGAKRICPKCSAPFYDLGKNPANCPKCGTSHDINAPVKARRTRAKSAVDAAELAEAKAKAMAEANKKAKVVVKEIDDIDLE